MPVCYLSTLHFCFRLAQGRKQAQSVILPLPPQLPVSSRDVQQTPVSSRDVQQTSGGSRNVQQTPLSSHNVQQTSGCNEGLLLLLM